MEKNKRNLCLFWGGTILKEGVVSGSEGQDLTKKGHQLDDRGHQNYRAVGL